MLASYLQRWSIETIFEESKGEVGMDHYEMRSCSWLPWLIISWSVWEFNFKNCLLRLRFPRFAFCFAAFYLHFSLTFKLLWSECAITRFATSSRIVLIARKNSLDLSFSLATLRCNTSGWRGNGFGTWHQTIHAWCGCCDSVSCWRKIGIEAFFPSLEQLLAMKLCAWHNDLDIYDCARRRLKEIVSGCGKDEIWISLEPYLVQGDELTAQYTFLD